jgi:hypothetical protein
MGTRAVLIMAAYLDKKGILGVRQTYPELDTCVANLNRMTRGGVINPRISVVL